MIGARMFDTARSIVLASLPAELSPAERRRALFLRLYPDLNDDIFPRLKRDRSPLRGQISSPGAVSDQPGATNASQPPAASSRRLTVWSRCQRTGTSFSPSRNTVSTAIQTRFMTPTTNISAINAQQQPTQ